MASSFDIAVIGAGPAGYTAALYARRAGRSVALVQGGQPGGQLTTTSDVENWPGNLLIGGPELMARMAGQVEALGVNGIDDTVVTCRSSKDVHRLDLAGGTPIDARAVIIATGAQARWLDAPGEAALRNRGVSGCAVCDGYFFRGHDVVVIGGGNTAVEEALYLSALCTTVTLVHRRDKLRADRLLQDRLAAKPNIALRWNTVVSAFLGDEDLTAVRLAGPAGGHEDLPAAGAFVAIGHDPATAFARGWIDLDRDGYVLIEPGGTATSRPGVFAAGDAADRRYRQAVTSAGTGCMAALDADRWLGEHGTEPVPAA
ncbi:NAD(P)/FAD-dependent oxidoreductase [Phreatobacter stygius]|uniref:Thioredoxin reductase n=1 Tax=Phreatobacter stygius TaxID=1940610 RepID=A0A4D7B6K4_9HYPH|nr:FAD-dependent oxidoreductase [Phreatobacter stygius]QCI66593.1 FAD-dependent oxidoreductase [Phreatobacter stygius]